MTATLPPPAQDTAPPDVDAAGSIVVGASEVPALFYGRDYFFGQGDLFAWKTGKAPRPAPSVAMRMGLLLEPVVYDLLEQDGITGERQVRLFAGGMRATIDLLEAPHPLPRHWQIKTSGFAGPVSNWNDWDGDYPPEHVTVQVTAELMVLRRARGVEVPSAQVAALLRGRGGPELRTYTIPWSAGLAEAIEARVDAFLTCCRRDLPPALPSLSVARMMKREEGKRTPIAVELCERLFAATEARKQVDKDEAEIKETIEGQLAIVGADTGDCPGWVVKSDERHRKEYVCKASTYRVLTVKPEKKRPHEREV